MGAFLHNRESINLPHSLSCVRSDPVESGVNMPAATVAVMAGWWRYRLD
jgi:hypothetical protein